MWRTGERESQNNNESERAARMRQHVWVQHLVWMLPVELLNLLQPVVEFRKLVRPGYGAQLFLPQTGREGGEKERGRH